MENNRSIRDPKIMKIHGIFKNLRESLSCFFNQHDQSLIRFSFGNTPSHYQFKVKFNPTHKSLKFIVNKDPDVKSVQCITYEKTKNIVLDIDEIYRERTSIFIDEKELKQECGRLLLWGLRKNENREKEIFKVDAVEIQKGMTTESFRDDKRLFCDVIVDYELTFLTYMGESVEPYQLADGRLPQSTERAICTFKLLSGAKLSFNIFSGQAETFKRNKLLVVNYLRRFNVMGFTTAKHHLNFSNQQYSKISTWLESQRGKNGT